METSNVIVYDGQCKFCTKFANWANNKNSALTILSVREPNAKMLLRERGVKFIDLQTIYCLQEEKVFVRSKAIFEILKLLKYPWKTMALFRYFPVAVTDFVYKQFAKYRYYF